MDSNPSRLGRLPTNEILSSKLEFLNELNRATLAAKRQLKKLRHRKDQVEDEIFAIRATNPPIKRLPVELHSHIFEEYVIPKTEFKSDFEDAGFRVAKILLVCKSWRNIAINTCSLWSYISVTVPKDLSLQDQFNSINIQHRYLDLFLSRSRQAPLKVVIDFEHMLDGAQLAYNDMCRVFGGLIKDEEIEAWLSSMPWASSSIPGTYLSLCKSLIQKIIGKDGQNSLRWSYLNIYLPDDGEVGSHILELLHYDAPRLEKLSVLSQKSYSEVRKGETRFMSSLTTLSELLLTRSDYLGAFSRCSALRKLDLGMEPEDYATTPFHLIKSFPVLDDLSFSCLECQVEDDIQCPTIHLPNLKSLELFGTFPRTFIQAIQINQLEALVIWQGSCTAHTVPIAHVCRIATSIRWDYSDTGDEVSDVLSTLFSQPLQASTIEVPHHAEEAAKEVILQCRARDQLKTLKSVFTSRRIHTEGKFVNIDQKLLMTI